MKQFDVFRLDTSNECLWRDNTQISLPPKPFAVLRYLAENPGRLITHDELLDALWPETYVQPQVLRTYVLELRKLLGDDATRPRFIQTLPKRGYCFVAPITESTHGHPAYPPAILNHARASKIVGREKEISRLGELVESMASGQRRVMFITGEAGIGKSALVEALTQQVGSSFPVCMARGQCVEGFGAKEEYYPVMEALGQLCRSCDGERACRILSEISPGWLGVSRSQGEADTVANIKLTGPQRMPGDLCAALEELATGKPVVLIFEDLHWADDATLQLISALARRRAKASLIVLATYRPQNVAAHHPFKALKHDLLMKRLCEEMALEPLSKHAVCELLMAELKQEQLPRGLSSFVHKHSDGNPLFAIAILEHLIAERFLICDTTSGSARWEHRAPFEEMELGVPKELGQMIELEISRLTPREQLVLEAGSLVSVAFPAWAVAAALDEDVAETEEACDGLARRLYFLERAGEDDLPDGTHSPFYVFAHGLYREVLYKRQASTRRSKRHSRIAERLGQLFSGREANVAREMAFHYEAADDWQHAVKALREAARHAQQRRAYAEAADLLEHTLKIAEKLSETEYASTVRDIGKELTLVRRLHDELGAIKEA
jgi:predicted ATPase